MGGGGINLPTNLRRVLLITLLPTPKLNARTTTEIYY